MTMTLKMAFYTLRKTLWLMMMQHHTLVWVVQGSEVHRISDEYILMIWTLSVISILKIAINTFCVTLAHNTPSYQVWLQKLQHFRRYCLDKIPAQKHVMVIPIYTKIWELIILKITWLDRFQSFNHLVRAQTQAHKMSTICTLTQAHHMYHCALTWLELEHRHRWLMVTLPWRQWAETVDK